MLKNGVVEIGGGVEFRCHISHQFPGFTVDIIVGDGVAVVLVKLCVDLSCHQFLVICLDGLSERIEPTEVKKISMPFLSRGFGEYFFTYFCCGTPRIRSG